MMDSLAEQPRDKVDGSVFKDNDVIVWSFLSIRRGRWGRPSWHV